MDLLRIVPLLRFRCAFWIPTYSLLGELARGDELQTLHPGGRYGPLGAHRINGLDGNFYRKAPLSFKGTSFVRKHQRVNGSVSGIYHIRSYHSVSILICCEN